VHFNNYERNDYGKCTKINVHIRYVNSLVPVSYTAHNPASHFSAKNITRVINCMTKCWVSSCYRKWHI